MIRMLFVTLCLLFAWSRLLAQHPSYSVVHFTTEDGLPQNSVTAIQFDKWGFCWLGTESGLVRFDGSSFTIFNSDNIAGLHSDRIRFGAADHSGNLFFTNEKAEHLKVMAAGTNLAPIATLGSGKEWIPHYGGEVAAPAMGQLIRSHFHTSRNLTFEPLGVSTHTGEYYLVNDGRLYFLSAAKKILLDSLQYEPRPFLLDIEGTCVALDGTRIIAWKRGIHLDAVKSIQGPLINSKAFLNEEYKMYNTGGRSFIYADHTLFELYFKEGQLHSRIIFDDLNIPTIGSMYYNEEQGKYYFGSLISGLYIVTPSAFHYPRRARVVVDEGFYPQVINDKGEVICNRYLYRQDSAVKLPMNRYVGITMFMNNQHQIYYGNDPSLFKFDLTTSDNRKILLLDSRPSSIFQDVTDSNTIILSTSYAIGKMMADSIVVMRRMPGAQTIMSTFQTGKDSFVIATQTGVHWYDLQKHTIYKSVLDSMYIRSIYTEPGGRVWISTMGRGFFLYENGKIHAFPVHPFNALKTIHAFVEDGRGNFWLPTNDGLFTVKKKQLLDHVENKNKEISYYKYSVADQLLTNEFNGGCIPAYQWLQDSILSLPSIQGIVQFRPHEMKPYRAVNPIFIETMELNNQPVIFPQSNRLTLEPSYSRLSLTLSCPYFGDRENLQLLYMIEGLDKVWQPVPADGKIHVNRVSAGDYTIRVRKLNGFDEAAAGLALPFTVNPWFYQTWWFYLLVAIFLFLISFVITWFRARILQERNRKLKEVITRQTKDLNHTVSQLMQSEIELTKSNQMKDRVTAMVLHDLRSPVRFLHTISKQLLQHYDTMPEADRRQALAMLKTSTGSLNDFTEQFFVWAASQHKGFKITTETFDLQDLFDEIQELYTDIVSISGNRLDTGLVSIQTTTDRQILAVIIRNLIDNANKNTYNGVITISAATHEPYLEISVADTGKGMSEAAINDFFNDNNASGSRGNGSIIVKTLLQKIDGTLQIEVGKITGTNFRIRLPHC